jgi:hypothetical protein
VVLALASAIVLVDLIKSIVVLADNLQGNFEYME